MGGGAPFGALPGTVLFSSSYAGFFGAYDSKSSISLVVFYFLAFAFSLIGLSDSTTFKVSNTSPLSLVRAYSVFFPVGLFGFLPTQPISIRNKLLENL